MPALTSTRRYGTGCGSEPDGRNTKNGGRLTTAISPSVEVNPRVPTDQQSGDDLTDPPVPDVPRAAGLGLGPPAQIGPQRRDEIEHRGALVAHLVHQ